MNQATYEMLLAKREQCILSLAYEESALLSLQLAEATQDPSKYIDACVLFYFCHKHHELQTIALQLLSSGFDQDARLYKVLAFSYRAESKWQEAEQYFRILNEKHPELLWPQKLLSHKEHIGKVLATIQSLKIKPQSVTSSGKDNWIYNRFSLQCPVCGKNYTFINSRSLFKIEFCPCPHCFSPHVLTPLSMAEALERNADLKDLHLYLGLDTLLWHWVDSWWNRTDCPSEDKYAAGASIFQSLSYHYRTYLAEMYADISSVIGKDKS